MCLFTHTVVGYLLHLRCIFAKMDVTVDEFFAHATNELSKLLEDMGQSNAALSSVSVLFCILTSVRPDAVSGIEDQLDLAADDDTSLQCLLDASLRVAQSLGYTEITPELVLRVGLGLRPASTELGKLQDYLRKLGYEPERIPLAQSQIDYSYREGKFNYGIDLNKKMRSEVQERPLIGRERELEELQIEILAEKSVILTGKPGVGKSALVEGLAWLIENAPGEVDSALRNFRFVSIQVADLNAGTSAVGSLDTKLKEFVDHFSASRETIVFIDEIHALFSGNQTSGRTISDFIKPALERGAIQIVGASTVREYQQYFAKDRALSERFQDILLEEPSPDEAVDIILRRGDFLLPKRIRESGISLSRRSAEEAVRLAKLHYENALPRKPIKILKAAGARKYFQRTSNASNEVDDDDVRVVVARELRVPKEVLAGDSDVQVQILRERLSSELFGQPIAVEQICSALLLPLCGMTDSELPTAIMSFVGPLKTGMMEAASVIAELVCGNADAVEVLNLTDYTTDTALYLLKGAPVGHVDTGEIETIFTKVRNRPHVLVFRSLELLRHDVSGLISAMISGRVNDNRNDLTDFSKCVFIFLLEEHTIPSDSFAAIGGRIENVVTFCPYDEKALANLLDSILKSRLNEKTIQKRFEKTVLEQAFRNKIVKEAMARGADGESLRIALQTELKSMAKNEIKSIPFGAK